jgi:hypothetical protein
MEEGLRIKNPLDYFRKLHEDGKLNRDDIPLIKNIIRLAREEENQAIIKNNRD